MTAAWLSEIKPVNQFTCKFAYSSRAQTSLKALIIDFRKYAIQTNIIVNNADKSKATKKASHKRKRHRKPSRIPFYKVVKMLKKKRSICEVYASPGTICNQPV